MIEPQSAHDGASAWAANATRVPPPNDPPRLPANCSSVRPLPLLLPFPLPLVAITTNSSFGAALAGDDDVSAMAAGSSVDAGARSGISSGVGESSVEPAAATASAGADEDTACVSGALAESPPPNPDGGSSTIADRSISPSEAFSSTGRKREPSQRKM